MGIVVEGELVLKAVPQGRLIEGHVGLEQFKVEWDVEPVTISICNSFVLSLCLVLIPCPDTNPIHVPVIQQVNALVLGITSFLSCPPEVPVISVDVGVINRQHLISRDLIRRFLHDCAADVLDHCSVGVSRCQRDRESQPRSPRHDEVVSTEVWETDQQLLVLGNCGWVVRHDLRLAYPFDPKGVAEMPVRVKLLTVST